MTSEGITIRIAHPADAPGIDRALHEFNLEFATPSPGVDALTPRVAHLLSTDATFAVVAGDGPFLALALATLRRNVWFDGPVALLDELVVEPRLRGQGIGSRVLARFMVECHGRGVSLVEINVDEPDIDAQRFYRRHGFTDTEPDSTDRAFYFWQELD